jgi:FkbM family methyltransferase
VKFVDGCYWPDGEEHMILWIADPKNRMMLNGRPAYQGKKQQAALSYCKQFRTAVDVGGHVGLWAHNLAQAFTYVHSFEPVAAHRECFMSNVLADNYNVLLHPCALGEKDGLVSIRSNPTSSGDSWIDGPGDIEMYRLDECELRNVDFIKIDTEGSELPVLRGGEETIKRCRPTIIVEQKPGMAAKFGLGETDAVKYLESLGATVRQVISGDYILTFE